MSSTETMSARLTVLPADHLLTLALKVDAVVTATNGIAYLSLAGPLGDLFGVPAGFLRAIGAFLIIFALGVWLVARRPIPLAVAVIAANAAWVAASLLLPLFDIHEPDTVGTVWVVLQAVTVGLFAVLQAVGLRSAGITTRP